MHRSTILITGGTGYIGTHIGLLFTQKNFRVILLDQSQNTHHYPWATSIIGNYGDTVLLSSIFNNYHIDAIIHCGTFNTPKQIHSFDHYQYDLINTIKLLEQMRIHGIRKFIFTSSASIYGNNAGIINHDTAKEPISSHGKSTQMIETILADYAQEFSYIILRLFCIAGGIPDHQILHSYNSYDQIIAALIESIITDKTFYYYDTVYQTPDGSSIHDYAHIWDIARAHFAAYEYLKNHENSEYFNIGSNKGTSVKQLIDITEKLMSKKIKTIIHKNKFAHSPRMIADISKTVDLLNWHPAYSDIEFILNTTYKCHF